MIRELETRRGVYSIIVLRRNLVLALNVDINRNCCYFETPRSWKRLQGSFVRRLVVSVRARSARISLSFSWSQHTNTTHTTTPGVARYKNMFSYNSRAAASKFHYRALMLNLVFDSGLTYRQLCKNSKKLWDEYVQAPPDNPSVNWGRWKEEASLAREHLSSVDFAKVARLFDMWVATHLETLSWGTIHDAHALQGRSCEWW